MFKPVNPKPNFPGMEEEVLKFWQENNIFEKSIEQRSADNEFVFYDGPPFATGLPHYGHLVPGTIKDVIPRYQAMKGKRVYRRFGWDCHGLPVENEIRKQLGISSHSDIEKFGVARYNDACRSIVLRYTNEWKQEITRMGRWVDFEHGYRTMDTDYMESIWWVFKTLYDKGLIYKGYNILPYSPGLGCPVSNMELNLGGYKDVTDQAVTVRFRLDGMDGKTYMLAWTTTPWTLPSNLALALGPDIDYVKLLDKASGDKYIIGEASVSKYYKDPTEYEILEHYKGSQLKGLRYEPLFPYFADLKKQGAFVTVLGDYVTTEDGCGIVHTAPGFGEDDYNVLRGTGIPVVCPVDDVCAFTDEIPEYKGRFVKDTDKDIIQRLKEEGKLIKRENFLHAYPFCWRTGGPLIYRAMSCWFVDVPKIRSIMTACNQQIHWVPSHLKDGRFGKWLEGAREWAISRNRFWGNPIPVWQCDGSDYVEVIGSREELEKKCGHPVEDLHKQYVDEITWPSPDGKGTMRRIPDVLDCWFESGSMPYAQQHYPFENNERFKNIFPADFICEGLDQTRGWFYSLTVLAAALFEKPAFMNCVTNGIVLNQDGVKMSKSLRNFTDPMIIVNEMGADALRFTLMNSAVTRAEDLKFSDNGVKETIKTLILPIWNAYSFFVTYANLDGYTPDPAHITKSINPMDIWVLSTAEKLVKDVTEALDNYMMEDACKPILAFIDNLNNWYIRRCRRRFWKSEGDLDKRAAYDTLYSVLMTLLKVSCPIIPFITETIYQNLRTDDMPVSIHLCDYPVYDEKKRAYELEKEMALTIKAISMGRALRASHNLKTRQPLKKVFLVDANSGDSSILEKMAEIIREELNVKEVSVQKDEKGLVSYSAKANFKILGSKLGKDMKDVAQKIQSMVSENIASVLSGKKFGISYGQDKSIDVGADDIVVQRTEAEGIKVLNEGELTVGFDTVVSKELLYEGIARDVVRSVQNLRKESGLLVSDRISLEVVSDEKDVIEALKAFKDYIAGETLAKSLEITESEPGADAAECGEHKVGLKLKKAE